ncbi:ATP-binding cassette domain-containing protein [Gordonia sp. ABSL1-1]|uniref:ATP-binding cassette domain-containing protein n=1 Tax=Gordonia sp. ABSL1-1 TaxID=3053923 RepID=UPI002573BAC2|nr:ATP-binding cassette domain-containing protein [Gordonia sp. ABSL1-1]MDL9937932.1 ATP-binding cassette domain-containing protein [Gordonia sp. ABSL1-1]
MPEVNGPPTPSSAGEPRVHPDAPELAESDPFQLPDPVLAQLGRWRVERAEQKAGRYPMPQREDPPQGEAPSQRAGQPQRNGYAAHNGVTSDTVDGVDVGRSEYPAQAHDERLGRHAGFGGPPAPQLPRPEPREEVFADFEAPTADVPAADIPTVAVPARPAAAVTGRSDPGRSVSGSWVDHRTQPPNQVQTPVPQTPVPQTPVPQTPVPQTSVLQTPQPGVETVVESGPATPALAIEVRNLQKRFKDTVAVEDVSFTVQPGSIVALLGPNGAGKTTTVNMLCTLLKPDGGTATVNGHDIDTQAAAVRKSIMLTGQFAALDEALTGRENLILFGRLLGLSKSAAQTRADELLDAFSLVDAGAKRVGQYSGGMRRRIDIACGLLTAPKVVFLDEPTTGLDPRSRQEVWTLVEKLRDSGVTILLTTQYLEEADVLSDNIVVIDKGRVIAEGTSDQLKASAGSAYCEVTPAHAADVPRLREALADLIAADQARPTDDHVVAVPAPDGPETLVEVIRRTAEAGIALSDVAMRRPSLDEVFLALTDPRRDRSS